LSLVSTDLELPAGQAVLIDAVREFAQTELFPLDRKWDRDESSVAEVLVRLGEMGLLNLCLPESLHGLGCSCRLYTALVHELAIWSPSTAVTVSVHNMVGNILNNRLLEPSRSQHLSRWSDPSNLAAFAISEAGAGSDARSAKTTAREVDGGFRLNGEKMWITNGLSARWFLMLVRLEGIREDESRCLMLVDGNQAGIERTKISGKMGIRGSETAVIHLTDVFVPESGLLGKRGEGLRICHLTLNEGRISIAAQATGIAEACITEMTRYAREREQFGRPIGDFQAVGNMVADSLVELAAAKALVWRAAAQVDSGQVARSMSAMAKLYATESANRIAYRAVQVHGGAGYVNECRVEQLYRDARVTTIYEGTSEIQHMVIASELARSRLP